MCSMDSVPHAAKLVPLGPPDAPLIVADYGSSQDRNSLAPLGRVHLVKVG
jgi:hypothetical protein